ncbi:hypothetical protein TraAM80_10357 [Trypanosoma rangeli]|uniref:PH domain-containing protein n=1 Tax=Trypanosoma rangeli TaxID=5698 RepID=A0A422MPP3_TRYRA|nr:uncharacterized protein TraAM80_10357 [Trypanosoma rangeli]RNE95174.1 hypothetical protein TraAM80_10357 [Trypanosoma rangeli]|eukprot:RNE95174.1 hypothetical protein TraAM80_10357 [Trypanosoma rangeli]
MTVRVQWLNDVPTCEGWIEKFSIGRGFFSTKSWQRRYVMVDCKGIGYMHSPPKRPMKPSSARCFVPFEGPRKRNGEMCLRPVYLLRHVTPFMHPEVPDKSQGTFASISSGSDVSCEYHYFAISFQERDKRFFMLLRTTTLEDYNVWTLVLSGYVPAGSINTVVPVPHPLVTSSGGLRCFLHPRLALFFSRDEHATNSSCGGFYVQDPDPCTEVELDRIHKLVLDWDEGEKSRWLTLLNEGSSMSTQASLLQGENEEEWVKLLGVAAELDAACEEPESSGGLTE